MFKVTNNVALKCAIKQINNARKKIVKCDNEVELSYYKQLLTTACRTYNFLKQNELLQSAENRIALVDCKA